MKIKFACFIITFLTFSMAVAQTDIKGDFAILENLSIQGKNFTVYSKSNSKKFKLKIEDKESQDFISKIDATVFLNSIVGFLDSNFYSGVGGTALSVGVLTNDEKKTIEGIPAKVAEVEKQKVEDSLSESQKAIRDVGKEKDQYSATLQLNDSIPYEIIYPEIDTDDDDDDDEQEQPAVAGGATSTDGDADGDDDDGDADGDDDDDSVSEEGEEIAVVRPLFEKGYTVLKGGGKLKLVDALVNFFNNRASTIYIKAILTWEDGEEEELIFLNNQFSVPLRYFDNYGSVVHALTSRKVNNRRISIKIDYNDVFDYEKDQFFNYSVANSQVVLSNDPDSKDKNYAQVVQRRFFDFFTAIVHSDVMGFNTNNSNALLNAQAKLLLPLNLKNNGKWTWGRQFTTSVNIALSNSFEDENRFIAIEDEENFSNFELLKRNNMHGKMALEVLTHEAKGWFTNIAAGYSAAFYRTGFRYTQTQADTTDIVTERQLFSIGHGPFLNFEIRPQNNFGADVTFSLEDLNYSDVGTIGDRSFKGDIINQTEKDHFGFAYNIINLEANFYWLTNPQGNSKGGVYARLGGSFHTDSNSIFPQLMVGYATNLTSFVNKFKAKTPEETSSDKN